MRRSRRSIVARKLFHHSPDLAPQLGILDSHECFCQRVPIVCREKFVHKVRGLGLALRSGGLLRRAFKEIWNSHLQHAGEMVQPAGADPVRSFLVFPQTQAILPSAETAVMLFWALLTS